MIQSNSTQPADDCPVSESWETKYLENFEITPTSSFFKLVFNQCPCVTWVLDVKSQTYIFISDNTLEYFGYLPALFMNKGKRFQELIIHPDDQQDTRRLLAQVWTTLSDISPEARPHYRFSHDYRIVKPDGKATRFLEQNAVLQQDESGNITQLLGMCSDITDCKKSGPLLARLSSDVEKRHFIFTADQTNDRKPSSLLSKRELEIIKLIAEGQSSKLIADKLYISFHTVNTHRQKMIEKTGAKNTSELIRFALSNRLI